MQQPELGQRLTSLRKQQQLTQEELAEKSHVSVRTIQRIEACEVLPRISTIKILLHAMGQTIEAFMPKQPETMETHATTPQLPGRHVMLIGAIAGILYLIGEIVLGAMDVIWYTNRDSWESYMNPIYIGFTVVTVVACFLFMRGFIALSRIFENKLLEISGWMMIATVTGIGILDVFSLFALETELILFAYIPAAVILGSITIVYGIALMRLQDGMGELSRVAGILEIIIGCTLVTVILFFVSYLVMIPAILVEVLLLFRGYEYLSRSQSPIQG